MRLAILILFVLPCNACLPHGSALVNWLNRVDVCSKAAATQNADDSARAECEKTYDLLQRESLVEFHKQQGQRHNDE